MNRIFIMALMIASVFGSAVAGNAAAPGASDAAVLENEHFRLRFTTGEGLRLVEFINKAIGDDALKGGANARLFVVTIDGKQYDAGDFAGKTERLDNAPNGRWTWRGQCAEAGLAASISINYDRTGESVWKLTLTNTGAKTSAAKVAFPVLDGMTVGPTPDTNRYFHGLNGGFMGDMPIQSFKAMYGYSLPVIDIYDEKAGGGIYLRIIDTSNCQKVLDVAKRLPGSSVRYDDVSGYPQGYADVLISDRLGMAVHYLQRELQPGTSFIPAAAVVAVHEGDWRPCIDAYQAWVKTWYRPRARRPRWFRETFVHKALHVQHIHPGDTYILLDNVQPKDAMFNLNHWMVSRGDYDVRPDWGGAAALREQLSLLRKKGVRSTLYLEALCVARDSSVGKAHGERWAVLQNGERVTSEPTVEWNFCPAVAEWRKYLAGHCAKLLKETGCDGLYLDSVGLRYQLCEDTAHGHVFGAGWLPSVQRLLQTVRTEMDKVNPEAVLYLEYLSSDVNTQYLDGSFSPCITAALGLRERGLNFQPTGTNLFRFYFPEFKFIEIMPESKEGIGLAFYNGNGIHGWHTNPDLRPYIENLAGIFEEYSDCFTSHNPVAYLQTLKAGVYANAFPGRGRTIYTLYNSNDVAVDGEVLPVESGDSLNYEELIESRELKVARKAGKVTIAISMEPREVLCIAATGK